MKRLLRGLVAGTLATFVMSAVMLISKRLGLVGAMPPEKVTAKLLNEAGIHRSAKEQDAIATALHFGFGAGAGAAFALVAPRPLLVRVPTGMAYGAAIWGVSYMGWVPAVGIMPAADRDRRDRQAVMLIGHLVFGAALGALVGRRSKPETGEPDDAGDPGARNTQP
jgi:uncharacterized membrane protein YagU involved in acid resistance